MLNSWVQAFRSCSEGAPGSISYAPLKLVMEALACLHRNTTPTERSLKAIKSFDKHDAPEIRLNRANDTSIFKSYIAQDKTVLADESSVFYSQFAQNWKLWFGNRWCVRKKYRSDRGNNHKHSPQTRFEKTSDSTKGCGN